MQRWTGVLARYAFVFSLAACASAALADALTDRAQRLLAQKQAKQAYDLLLPQEGARAGDPEFDYLLGVAALDSGNLERAVFALERVLAVQPNNHVARAEIARAYLEMGERDSAKREFESVRSQSIPEEVKANIDRYLSAIATSDVRTVTGYLELGVGYDTNVNFATANSLIALPAFNGNVIDLGRNGARRADTFAALAGGVNLTYRLSPEWAIVGGASGNGKFNRDANEFDMLTLDGNLGMRWARGKEAITVAAQMQEFQLDYTRFRESTGGLAQWQHTFDELRQFTLFAHYSELRYPTVNIRNTDRKIFGVGYSQGFSGEYSPTVYGSLYGGREDEIAEGAAFVGHVAVGARLGGQVRLRAGLSAFANTSYENRKYGGPDPFFSNPFTGETTYRRDRQLDAGGGLSYVIRPGTTLIGQVAYTDNRSNIELARFRRTVSTVSLRFNF